MVLARLSSQSATSTHAGDTGAAASCFTSSRIHDSSFAYQLFLIQLGAHSPDLLRSYLFFAFERRNFFPQVRIHTIAQVLARQG